MSRRTKWNLITVVVLLLAAGGLAGYYLPGLLYPKQTAYADPSGIKLKFKTEGDQFLEYRNEKFEPLFVKGVNLGATVPGHFPGEFPVDEETYLRWFRQIHDMGANVIRVYTVHQPVFYKALVKFNREEAERPLYFIQGIWSPEEQLIEKQDAYLPEIQQEFKQEIEKAVKAVYGDLDIPVKPGTAGGEYKQNAGQYLMAWHLGTEWDPAMVDNTNRLHKDVKPYQGSRFQATEKASPFESWLAEMIDHAAELERRYGWQHPMTFTNWVTTDVLTHPGEPLFQEDMASVDARHIQPVDWKAGYFAAYHVYPYYPDFFHLDKTLQTIKDENGQFNTYKAYLRKLKAEYPDMPVMITEYGVPASVGISHLGMGGRNQGGHDEREQGRINASLTKDIYDERFAGAILFMWQDEWFKKTWNTMRFEIPDDRRSYWLNVLTNEQLFGVLGMYPSKEEQIVLDGDWSDWEAMEDKVQLKTELPGIREMWATHDEAYVYLALKLDKPFDPKTQKLHIGSSVLEGGNRTMPELPGLKLDEGLETLITLGTDQESEIRIASNYDFNNRLYGPSGYWMVEPDKKELQDNSGIFNPWKLAVSLKMEPPDTRTAHPFQDVTVGKLIRGTNNPRDEQYQSLASWQYSGDFIEMRIPWMLLGFADPSSKQVISYDAVKDKRTFTTVKTEGIRFLPWLSERGQASAGKKAEPYAFLNIPVYQWDEWEQVGYTERLKQSYTDMKTIFEQLGAE
ncbi:hypothetical protein HFN20_24545 [Paenibacillus dendritiformis]|uniref:hypothetical protein n=1 Tax=Paenibacillus dendritiformis TaxID=130049 RepID=UPI00143DB51E|nr:hypothetical protein [Paenibacillus dendritiformis]NKI24339.1 hypothetical protein [Paenibacillus dendritiformis]NRF96961.1 hypothetical protein [Paenibacillus dendritiformis]